MGFHEVKAYLDARGVGHLAKSFDVSSATVELAAQAAGVEPQRIAKTLAFKSEEAAILVVAAGDVKVDNKKFKNCFGYKARFLDAEAVQAWTGHQVGGVCPFALKNPLPVYLDESLKRFPTVFPACGSASSAVELTPDLLFQVSDASGWVDVTTLREPSPQE